MLALGWAIFSLLCPVLEFVTNYALVDHRLLIAAGRAGNEDAFWEDIVGLIGNVVYDGLIMIYPAVLLYRLPKPDVRRAFAKPTPSENVQVGGPLGRSSDVDTSEN